MRDDTQLLNNGLDSELDSYDTAEDIKRTDYIYMVSGNNLVISLNAELDHHLADEMREVIDDIIDKRGVDRVIIDFSCYRTKSHFVTLCAPMWARKCIFISTWGASLRSIFSF